MNLILNVYHDGQNSKMVMLEGKVDILEAQYLGDPDIIK